MTKFLINDKTTAHNLITIVKIERLAYYSHDIKHQLAFHLHAGQKLLGHCHHEDF